MNLTENFVARVSGGTHTISMEPKGMSHIAWRRSQPDGLSVTASEVFAEIHTILSQNMMLASICFN